MVHFQPPLYLEKKDRSSAEYMLSNSDPPMISQLSVASRKITVRGSFVVNVVDGSASVKSR
jgi:hypothetical protein